MEEEMVTPEEAMPPEEQMPAEEQMPPDSVPMEEESAGEYEGEIPAGMQQDIVEGATALFHTSIQVFNAKEAKERVKRWLRAGNITDAAMYALMEAVKNHTKQKLPVSPPMMIGAAPYVVTFAQTLSEKMGQDVTDATAKKCTLEVIDQVIGLYKGGKLADEHKAQAEQMQRQQPQMPPGGGQPGGGQPGGGGGFM
jgi:hypothetical protein